LFYTEEIYQGASALALKVTETNSDGIATAVNAWLNPKDMGEGYDRSRSLISVSSCGICGKKELADLIVKGEILETDEKLEAQLVAEMFTQMRKSQVTFDRTGGSHAAACFDLSGALLDLREDIGRHNAVDKVIGALLEKGMLAAAKCLLVSGRISFEIVSKVYKAGIPFLAAVSAPSSLAVECARAMGMTLLGYCRGDQFTCYAYEERILTGQVHQRKKKTYVKESQ
jgi:FdhD protein